MTFSTLLENLLRDTTQTSLGCFAPELILCGTVVALLLVRLFNADRVLPIHWTAMIGTVIAFVVSYFQFAGLQSANAVVSQEFFTGLLVFDQFTVFFRLFLLLFLILVIALTVLSGIPDNEDGPDFYSLLIGATVGMMLMVSANHLLILFLAIEMASVPSYVMVGFLKGRRTSSEAAFKYVVYGAGAAGVMLYGISLLAGLLGTLEFPLLASRMSELVAGGEAGMADPVMRTALLAIMLILVGLAFKLSAVPFHFWAPDAFQGAPAEVGAFLSVASKGAAFALLIRFALAFVAGPAEEMTAEAAARLQSIYLHLGIGIGVIAAVTATFGNLAAYAQTNVKRLLAYSTIAHAGYMLMAVGAMMVIRHAPDSAGLSEAQRHADSIRALEGLLYYLAVYLFMNLGAFAIVALIRNRIYSEEIADYAGLAQEAPALCVGMVICLVSLVGLPPLGGFVGKFMIFASLFDAGKIHWSMWAILVFGGLNTVFSLFFYMRVLRAMFLEPRPAGARDGRIPFLSAPGLYVTLVSLPILALGMTPLIANLSAMARNVAAVVIVEHRDDASLSTTPPDASAETTASLPRQRGE
ncbi:MAG: NADH-quinone oxidoreductase subunit N [Planctomycetaceae bacterium]